MTSPEWPFTHRGTPKRPASNASMSGSHRSRLATGLPAAFLQPRSRQPRNQRSRKQLAT